MDTVQLDGLISNAAAYRSSIDTLNEYIEDLLFKKRTAEYQILGLVREDTLSRKFMNDVVKPCMN